MSWDEPYCEDPKNSVWNMDWLVSIYNKEIVPNLLSQSWAIDEMECGIPTQKIVDSIWEGFESWAEKYLKDQERDYWEGYVS